jgi:hypothetical protein
MEKILENKENTFSSIHTERQTAEQLYIVEWGQAAV